MANEADTADARDVPPARDPLQTAELAGRTLFATDRASQALGMRVTRIAPGDAQVTMTVRADMVNGHAICHGGLIFTLADTAFAFACNSYGDNTIAAGATIDFLAPGLEGDVLTATAREVWRGGRSGIYESIVANQRNETIAIFRGRSQRIAGRFLD